MSRDPVDLMLLPFPYAVLSATKKRPVLIRSLPDRQGDFIGWRSPSCHSPSKSFNIDVPDRTGMMRALLEGKAPEVNGENESVRNLGARYANIVDHVPQEIADAALPFFIDWLLENVHLVAIEDYSEEDAYTIFETMNDRGLSLSLPDMLKGYVLANVTHEDDQRAVNAT